MEKARYWSTQARDPDLEGINNYVHSEVGYNYRMSNVIAGIVRGQLEVLETRVQQRRAVFERYATAFADLEGVQPQPEAEFATTGLGDTGEIVQAVRGSVGAGKRAETENQRLSEKPCGPVVPWSFFRPSYPLAELFFDRREELWHVGG